MIYIADLHIKEKEVYRRASFNFLNWLLENYKNEIIIQGGDLFDSSSINHQIVADVLNILKQFREVHLLGGNHETSRRLNSILLPFHQENIHVYLKETEINIEGMECLMLPYQYNIEHYNTINWECDFCFAHFTPIQEQFNNEGIDTSGIKAKKIFGHIHTANEHENGNMIIAGVPLPTRNGETSNPILQIKDGIITKIQPPKFFDICDIEYGEEINTDYLYNIKNAPSYEAIYKKYPEINVREEGITLIQKIDKDTKTIEFNLKEDSLKHYFMVFCREKELNRNIMSTGIKYMERYS